MRKLKRDDDDVAAGDGDLHSYWYYSGVFFVDVTITISMDVVLYMDL